jgi:hypothetical protein
MATLRLISWPLSQRCQIGASSARLPRKRLLKNSHLENVSCQAFILIVHFFAAAFDVLLGYLFSWNFLRVFSKQFVQLLILKKL